MSPAVRNVRNIAIILLVAVAVDAIPGGGAAAQTVLQALYLGFLAAFAWILSRLYREHRVALYSLGDENRALLYGALGVLMLTLTATSVLWETSLGSIAWLVLVGCAALALVRVVRAARSY